MITKFNLFESVSELSDKPITDLDKQVEACIRYYPGLYDKKYGRKKVLYHMYFGYGTGYEWVDGKLIDEYGSEKEMAESHTRHLEKERKDIIEDIEREKKIYDTIKGIGERTGEKVSIDLQRMLNKINELEELSKEPEPYRFPQEETPLSVRNGKQFHYSDNYSPIFNIPEDVDKQYLDGGMEILNYILSSIPKGSTESTELLRLKSNIQTRFRDKL